MMYGLLIYDEEGAARNEWFIGELIRSAGERETELRLVLSKDLPFGCSENRLFFDFPDGRKPDFAIVRTVFPLLSQCLEEFGVRVFNRAKVSMIANDKRRTHAFLSARGFPCAQTVFLTKSAFDPHRLRYPAIIKSADGHGGNEVFHVEETKSASSAVEKIGSKDFLVQEVVDKGRDLRAYVLGNRVLASVLRTSEADFRSNFSLGGHAGLFDLPGEMRAAAVKIAKSLRSTFIGVDFTFKNNRPLVNEIEDVVGARMLYALTDLPVHDLLIDEILKEMKAFASSARKSR